MSRPGRMRCDRPQARNNVSSSCVAWAAKYKTNPLFNVKALEEKIYNGLRMPGSWYPPPPCYLTKLPNEILVDQVFRHLEVIDIIRLRQICKLFYDLTHHAVLWKRLLRRAGVPVPPLPHTIPNMSGVEIERLLLRAISLARDWNSTEQMPANVYDFNAHHQIHSMFILPGGRYLIASTSDKAESTWSIVIYMMDHRVNEVVALAKPLVKTKAIHINARYMTIGGVWSIVIAYVRREFLHHRHRRPGATPLDVSQYSGDYEILDPEFPLKYECNVVSISLSQLEILGDPGAPPGPPEFIEYLLSQELPFRLLTQIRSESILARPVLEEIFGSPYLALMKQPDKLMFKNLGGGQASTLTMPTYQLFPQRHEIRTMSIRLNPLQDSVIVLRRMVMPRPEYNPQTDAYMTDHGIPTSDDEAAMPYLHSAEESKVPRPIVIFWKRTVLQLPPTPPGAQVPAQAQISYSYRIEDVKAARRLIPGDNLRYQPLVGTMRSILYKVPKDDITDTPLVVAIARHIDPDAYLRQPVLPTTAEEWELDIAEIELPSQVYPAEITAMAWDESIGRLIVAQKKYFWITVLDFSAAPRVGKWCAIFYWTSLYTDIDCVVLDKDGSRLPFAASINNDLSEISAPLPNSGSILSPHPALNDCDERTRWQGYREDFIFKDYKDIGVLLQRAKDWAQEDAMDQESSQAILKDGPSQNVMDDIRDDDTVQVVRDTDSVQGVGDNEHMAPPSGDSRNGEQEQAIRDDESILSYTRSWGQIRSPNTESRDTNPTHQLSANDPKVSVLGFGAMDLATWNCKADKEEGLRIPTNVTDRGITFCPTYTRPVCITVPVLSIHGMASRNEGRRVQPAPRGVVAVGAEQQAAVASQTDYIGLCYQHRVDLEIPIEVTANMREFVHNHDEDLPVDRLVLSECSSNVMKRVKCVLGIGKEIMVRRVEYIPFMLEIGANGFAKAAHALYTATEWIKWASGSEHRSYAKPDSHVPEG
ncbi:hypothetical protein POSPLADRAFT_1042132 [Postia placenta MAD-698-R-SB12]|uniref:F-box domain-containing protein n=1 Tax=Postia placenta MAD-698-R-SB12 TaxID=670580 RepID=A0A1X6NDV2_9APHY|nr:hypothetical protein POSPLADRAFT_1042132 [Postia placenta MAD-698-R-SB12]OSX66821.1 hypothetical protein POSPLADRAFT_1042132 [Postia placenta MAD-698-R-SB12]